jgi:hypothetical protein
VIVLGSSHSTFAVLDGLKNGVTYTVSITANNVAGSGKPATVVVTPGSSSTPPPPPGSLTAPAPPPGDAVTAPNNRARQTD